MVEFEADDALAAAAAAAARDARVERVIICTPDKDLAQCVRGTRVVQLDRRARTIARRGGRGREVRRAAGVDSRLSGARRRRRRRLSRTARLGREVRRRRCSPRSAFRERSRRTGAPGASTPRARRALARHAAARARTRHSCFARWRRCAPTCRSSNPWTNWRSKVRRRSLRGSARGCNRQP